MTLTIKAGTTRSMLHHVAFKMHIKAFNSGCKEQVALRTKVIVFMLVPQSNCFILRMKSWMNCIEFRYAFRLDECFIYFLCHLFIVFCLHYAAYNLLSIDCVVYIQSVTLVLTSYKRSVCLVASHIFHICARHIQRWAFENSLN